MTRCRHCAEEIPEGTSRCTRCHGDLRWREGGPGRLAHLAFLGAVIGLGLAVLGPMARPAAAHAVVLRSAAAEVRCPEGDAAELVLPPGHPPVPGYAPAPALRLPPGHPPVGAAPGGVMFPQDAPRTL